MIYFSLGLNVMFVICIVYLIGLCRRVTDAHFEINDEVYAIAKKNGVYCKRCDEIKKITKDTRDAIIRNGQKN